MPDDRDVVPRHDETSMVPDLHGLSLEELLGADDSPLSTAVRRLHRYLKDPGPPFAAHGTTP